MYMYEYIFTYTYIYIYIYMCVCMQVRDAVTGEVRRADAQGKSMRLVDDDDAGV